MACPRFFRFLPLIFAGLALAGSLPAFADDPSSRSAIRIGILPPCPARSSPAGHRFSRPPPWLLSVPTPAAGATGSPRKRPLFARGLRSGMHGYCIASCPIDRILAAKVRRKRRQTVSRGR